MAVEKLEYPRDVKETSDKLAFCYIAQEKLRVEHNVKGKDYREGKISANDFKEYKDGRFKDKGDAIIEELVKMKNAMKISDKYAVDLDKDIK